jgi:hypothetical protein
MTSLTFGPAYPELLTDSDGTLMPLVEETRWSRIYRHPTTGRILRISRFMDGSASMSLDGLRENWPKWTPDERHAFSRNAAWLRNQADFPNMLRFMMDGGDKGVWVEIALSVAKEIPQEEAFDLLSNALHATEVRDSTNILQGLAETRHPLALGLIRTRLDMAMTLSEIWHDEPGYNRLASAAICSIEDILDLGGNPADFEQIVRALAEHPSPGTRDICRQRLRSRYSWLSPPSPHPG